MAQYTPWLEAIVSRGFVKLIEKKRLTHAFTDNGILDNVFLCSYQKHLDIDNIHSYIL